MSGCATVGARNTGESGCTTWPLATTWWAQHLKSPALTLVNSQLCPGSRASVGNGRRVPAWGAVLFRGPQVVLPLAVHIAPVQCRGMGEEGGKDQVRQGRRHLCGIKQ